jgi:hypothetical protein|tara:strand:+ start:1763 stop:3148 length:1386 start_codon:yes stop_codon:yes gene_type:complete
MDPATLATMYAINVGINALGGKRGSNLFKDSFKDTATMALTQQFMPSSMTGINTGSTQQSSGMLNRFASPDSAPVKSVLSEQSKNLLNQQNQGRLGQFFSAIERPFRDPITGDISKFRVGLGALGAAGAAYGLGAFDPVQPPDPKYPGYNKFYAQNPEQFMPFDDPDFAIDYSEYPDKPYSGLRSGGIMGLDEGGAVGLEAQINQMKKTPEGLRKLMDMIPGSVTEYTTGKDNTSAFSTNEQVIKEYIKKNTKGVKDGGIMGFEDGGQVAPDLLREEYEKYKQQKDSAGEEAMDFEQFKQFRMQFGPMKEGGITKLMAGGRASNMPIESIEESTQEQMDMIPPPMSSISPRQMFMPMMMAKDGALVDRLPSKTNTDEKDASNYKRTTGKLVVDAAGKGNEEKDTMLAQLADGEFVTKSKAVRGAGIALGADPRDKKQQRELGARFFYKQMADFDKLAKSMS